MKKRSKENEKCRTTKKKKQREEKKKSKGGKVDDKTKKIKGKKRQFRKSVWQHVKIVRHQSWVPAARQACS